MHLKLDPWKTLFELRDERGDQIGVDRRKRTHYQAAALGAEQVVDDLLGLIQFAQRPLRMHMKQFACLSEDYFPAEPVEEPRPQFFFQTADLDRERRLRHMHMLRGPAEVLVGGHGHEILNLA